MQSIEHPKSQNNQRPPEGQHPVATAGTEPCDLNSLRENTKHLNKRWEKKKTKSNLSNKFFFFSKENLVKIFSPLQDTTEVSEFQEPSWKAEFYGVFCTSGGIRYIIKKDMWNIMDYSATKAW